MVSGELEDDDEEQKIIDDDATSVISSQVDSDTESEGGDLADMPPYEDMTFLKVKMCKCCMHSSNERNPVTVGPNAQWPSWPWKYGNPRQPSGSICKFCPMLLGLAGFKGEFKSLTQVATAMKTSDTLADEWRGALDALIHAFNTRRLKKRIRGNLRSIVNGELSKIRAKIVETIKRTGLRTIEKFRAVALTRWKQKFPGRDPVADGFLVKTLPIQNKKVECVLVRKLPDLEWDLELDTSIDVLMRETTDDGSLNLRERQQDDLFAGESKGIAAIGQGSTGRCWSLTLEESRNPLKWNSEF